MKIEYDLCSVMALDAFAKQYDLTMQVVERHPPYDKHGKYLARLKNVELKTGAILESVYSNGETIEEAIKGYCKAISHKRLVVNAYKDTRTEVTTPTITPIWTEEAI